MKRLLSIFLMIVVMVAGAAIAAPLLTSAPADLFVHCLSVKASIASIAIAAPSYTINQWCELRKYMAGGLKAATTNRDQITAWWAENPAYNIGLATGEISNLFVVDVDGQDAEHELRRLGLPATVEAITARGRHLYLARL
jgi:Bifunctional DNA primase/polymerase, N-terminal